MEHIEKSRKLSGPVRFISMTALRIAESKT
jgi:hypothetical protein